MGIFSYFAVIALLIVIISVVNEKRLHIQSDIVLVIFSLGISAVVLLLVNMCRCHRYKGA